MKAYVMTTAVQPLPFIQSWFITMRYLAPILLLLLLASCREIPVEETNSLDILFDTKRSEYQKNQNIALVMQNNTMDTILIYSECLEMDQKINGEWEFYAYEGDVCSSASNKMTVGASFEWEGIFWGVEIPEGEYRLAMDILLQEDWRQRERLVSRAFEIR